MAAVTAAIAGSVGYVYLVGGIVMWLRLQAIELPADTLVAAAPREQLLEIGLVTIVFPLSAAGIAVALMLKTRLDVASMSQLLAALALAMPLFERDIALPYKLIFATAIVVVVAPLLPAIVKDVLLRVRPRTKSAEKKLDNKPLIKQSDDVLAVLTETPRRQSALYIGAALAIVLYPALVIGTALAVAVVVTLAVSFVGGTWVEKAESDNSRIVRGVLVAAVIALAFRATTELQQPSPLEPAIVYANRTSDCQLGEPESGKANPNHASLKPCRIPGYLVLTTSDTIYVAAPARNNPDLDELGSSRRTDGTLLRLPPSSIVEIRSRQEVDVRGPRQHETPPIESVTG